MSNGGIVQVSKIVKYKIEQDVIALRQQNLSYQKIADEMNASGKVPAADPIDKFVVMRFLDTVPAVTKEIVSNSKRRMVEVVNSQMDVIFEVKTMYEKTKAIINAMEEDWVQKNKPINAYAWKALISEMREMLKHMGDIQREINDYDNVRKFMEVVIETLSDECPEKIPTIAERLRAAKGTQWFADLIGGGNKEGDKK
jgi:hypothetical protein